MSNEEKKYTASKMGRPKRLSLKLFVVSSGRVGRQIVNTKIVLNDALAELLKEKGLDVSPSLENETSVWSVDVRETWTSIEMANRRLIKDVSPIVTIVEKWLHRNIEVVEIYFSQSYIVAPFKSGSICQWAATGFKSRGKANTPITHSGIWYTFWELYSATTSSVCYTPMEDEQFIAYVAECKEAAARGN